MKRMSMKFSRIIIWCLLAGAVGAGVQAQTYTQSRRIVRSFPTAPETRLDVTNKYGKIQVIPWKKDSVRIEVDLFVQSNSTNKLEKLQDNIDFDFSGTKYYVIARTNFGSKYSGFFTDLKELSENFIPSKNKVEINYTIRMPANMAVNISNKYGDLYIDDLKGTVNINLSNGDLKINRLDGEANINLNFGNGIINYYQGGRLTLSYADIEIKEAITLDIDTRSSKLNIDKASILNITSRRDRISVSELDNIFGDAYFTDIRISNLNEEVNFVSNYGDFRADNISREFTYINLNSEYTDISLTFSEMTEYFMDIIHHEECIVRLPEENSNYEIIEESGDIIRMNGTIGSGGKGRVKITAQKKCIITLTN